MVPLQNLRDPLHMLFTEMCPSHDTKHVSFELLLCVLRGYVAGVLRGNTIRGNTIRGNTTRNSERKMAL